LRNQSRKTLFFRCRLLCWLLLHSGKLDLFRLDLILKSVDLVDQFLYTGSLAAQTGLTLSNEHLECTGAEFPDQFFGPTFELADFEPENATVGQILCLITGFVVQISRRGNPFVQSFLHSRPKIHRTSPERRFIDQLCDVRVHSIQSQATTYVDEGKGAAMNLIFLGPPGAGKGTMASRLAEDQKIPHISTGDIFRANIKNQTDLGKRVKAILDRGDLVPDELTIELVKDRLAQKDTAAGYILDGFPRTIPQAEALTGFSKIDHVVNFALSDEEVVKRLSGRRVAPSSGRTYHVIFNPPQKAGIDDDTGEKLIVRPDDEVDAVKNRLQVYINQTEPLIKFYTDRHLLKDLDASPKPDSVFAALRKLLSA